MSLFSLHQNMNMTPDMELSGTGCLRVTDARPTETNLASDSAQPPPKPHNPRPVILHPGPRHLLIDFKDYFYPYLWKSIFDDFILSFNLLFWAVSRVLLHLFRSKDYSQVRGPVLTLMHIVHNINRCRYPPQQLGFVLLDHLTFAYPGHW